jgi:rhodanese-related sulfurtransferase
MIEDVDAGKVWEALEADPSAQLCDVRTDAEWNFVGLPELQAIDREPVLIPWQVYPSMQRNGAFVDHLRKAGLSPAAGFVRVYNVAEGFEGPPDPDGHRGTVSGWKAAGLPWRQR